MFKLIVHPVLDPYEKKLPPEVYEIVNFEDSLGGYDVETEHVSWSSLETQVLLFDVDVSYDNNATVNGNVLDPGVYVSGFVPGE